MFVGVNLRQVRDLEKVMRSQLSRLEPGDVPLGDAPAIWQAYDAIERLAASAKTLLAGRVDESGVWRRAGDRGAPEYLARKAGTSLGAARSSLETSKQVSSLPRTRAALRRGELSRAQADEIAGAAAVDPDAEQSLLNAAAGSSLSELRQQCARTRAAGDPDPDATQRRINTERRVRRWTDREGAWNLAARGTAADGSRFNAVLDPIINELFHAARGQGRREPRDAYAFDALIELARRDTGTATPQAPATSTRAPTPQALATGTDTEGDHAARARVDPTGANRPTGPPGGDAVDGASSGIDPSPPSTADEAPAQVAGTTPAHPEKKHRSVDPTHLALLRIDLAALVRGKVQGEELCEIAGIGPVPVATARQLLSESILKLVITRGVDVANVTHLGRGPTTAQHIALLWTSPACTVLGCPRTHRQGIQHDHRSPWTQVHETTLANLDELCDHHHKLKTLHGWALVPGTGPRPMVPPHDPRHPTDQPPHTDAQHPHEAIRPDGAPPCDSSPRDSSAGETPPDETPPGESSPSETRPCDTPSYDSSAGETPPGDTPPGDSSHGDSPPCDVRGGDAPTDREPPSSVQPSRPHPDNSPTLHPPPDEPTLFDDAA